MNPNTGKILRLGIGLALAVGAATNWHIRSRCIEQLYKEAATNNSISTTSRTRIIGRAQELESERSRLLTDPAYVPFYSLFTERYDFHPQKP